MIAFLFDLTWRLLIFVIEDGPRETRTLDLIDVNDTFATKRIGINLDIATKLWAHVFLIIVLFILFSVLELKLWASGGIWTPNPRFTKPMHHRYATEAIWLWPKNYLKRFLLFKPSAFYYYWRNREYFFQVILKYSY